MHERGLQLGIYEDYGTQTCGGYPGSLDYLELDAQTFAEWDVDMLKLDDAAVMVPSDWVTRPDVMVPLAADVSAPDCRSTPTTPIRKRAANIPYPDRDPVLNQAHRPLQGHYSVFQGTALRSISWKIAEVISPRIPMVTIPTNMMSTCSSSHEFQIR